MWKVLVLLSSAKKKKKNQVLLLEMVLNTREGWKRNRKAYASIKA
jgi:hypothetical protein